MTVMVKNKTKKLHSSSLL